MYVKMMVPECDFNSIRYEAPVEGAGAVARGASGRWCVVMYAGPEYLAEHGITPITHEEAYAQIEEPDYPDF